MRRMAYAWILLVLAGTATAHGEEIIGTEVIYEAGEYHQPAPHRVHHGHGVGHCLAPLARWLCYRPGPYCPAKCHCACRTCQGGNIPPLHAFFLNNYKTREFETGHVRTQLPQE